MLRRIRKKKKRGSEFVFNSIDLLHFNLPKLSLNRGGLYIDSAKWLKSEKTTINPKNDDDKCFQGALTVELNYGQIKKKTYKEYQKLSLLLNNMIRKR